MNNQNKKSKITDLMVLLVLLYLTGLSIMGVYEALEDGLFSWAVIWPVLSVLVFIFLIVMYRRNIGFGYLKEKEIYTQPMVDLSPNEEIGLSQQEAKIEFNKFNLIFWFSFVIYGVLSPVNFLFSFFAALSPDAPPFFIAIAIAIFLSMIGLAVSIGLYYYKLVGKKWSRTITFLFLVYAFSPSAIIPYFIIQSKFYSLMGRPLSASRLVLPFIGYIATLSLAFMTLRIFFG